ncbi:L,D-transpeptidase family protein [Sinorhizobium meliloti]|uniref:L,D-transpeptidase family protein n=1 Tax=Rhizobium meliloti TaxID=382 RepID=UPI0012972112|nr:murein L,D-transpeptidase [Sinorhizobium meliloti]MDW9594622.1 L,D-transpeptidase family protein [Sinorhizobium meliloti]MDX0190607.1 L,D-transpeptidase family protein [Sinorhizobium meliloti]MQV07680.1 L,D-transpeptidase family protein [Sinorhizobium meliloti]MQV10056.1 L,D-transpeptidase family protein [Sinorhizobium meliloti]MQV61717.1 L,D-transpeptidase family protein [Sinorhizobium meliloti]
MRIIKSAAIVTLMSGCVVATMDVQPASAITFMDFIRGGKKRDVQEQVQPRRQLPGVDMFAPQRLDQKAAKPPRITGPRYYTYKAEPLRRIATDRLVDPVVTGSVLNGALPPMLRSPLADARQFLPEVDVRAPAEVAKAVENFYGTRTDFLWIEGTGVSGRAKAALGVLSDAAKVGLDPLDYAVIVPPEDFDRGDMIAREKDLVRFEIAMSAAVLTYVQDTVRGRIDPNRISGYHDFKRKNVDLLGFLEKIETSSDVGALVESQNPKSAQFTALRQELERLRTQVEAAPRVEIAPGTLLKPGESNPELANVIAGIKLKASEALKTEHAVVLAAYEGTPDYTPELVPLVEAFQKEYGLKADGIVGQASIRALTGGDTTEGKIDKVEIAMEQARWLPDGLGDRYVFINQPAFTASYTEQGTEQFSMRVVVGSKANQTYFFQDEIQTVEVNPYWGVPQSIIVNEMLPKLRNDPGYLDRMGYQVEVGGRVVPSTAVNWYGSTNSIAVRQPPSSDNALGELKILFPNAHAIYMHDTPSKSFFKRDQRALSHGCVRLADPRRMAAAVLGVSVDEVGMEISGGRNKALPVSAKVPVYVSYFTAWPNKDGTVEYFDDVYERDMYMNRAFEATRKARSLEG